MLKKVSRDSTFTLLFKHEKYVADLYELCTGEKIDPSTIRSIRLEDGLVRSRVYNDVSFLTEDHELLVLIEHQTTPNKNMAFRMLEYDVLLVNEFIKQQDWNKFGTKQIHLPKAKFWVVYNGKGEMKALPLLDLGDVQVKAKVFNIHFEKLPDQEDRNNAVVAYARFIELAETMFVNEALDQLLEEGYLLEFFGRRENRDMFAEVFSYDNELINFGREQGIEQGLEQGILGMVNAMKGLEVDSHLIAQKLKEEFRLSEEKIQDYLQ